MSLRNSGHFSILGIVCSESLVNELTTAFEPENAYFAGNMKVSPLTMAETIVSESTAEYGSFIAELLHVPSCRLQHHALLPACPLPVIVCTIIVKKISVNNCLTANPGIWEAGQAGYSRTEPNIRQSRAGFRA